MKGEGKIPPTTLSQLDAARALGKDVLRVHLRADVGGELPLLRPQATPVVLGVVGVVHEERPVGVGQGAVGDVAVDQALHAVDERGRRGGDVLVADAEPVRVVELKDDAVRRVVQVDQVAALVARDPRHALGDGLERHRRHAARGDGPRLGRLEPVVVVGAHDALAVGRRGERGRLGGDDVARPVQDGPVVVRQEVGVGPGLAVVDGGLGGEEFVKDAGGGRLAVVEEEERPDLGGVEGRELGRGDDGGLGVLVVVLGKVPDGSQDLVRLGRAKHHVAAPDLADRVGLEDELCHDAKVVAAAAQGHEELRVGRLRRRDDGAVGQHHLGLDDLVGRPAVLRAEEAEAAAQEVAAHAHVADAAADDGDVLAVEGTHDVVPTVTGANGDGVVLGVVHDPGVQGRGGDERAVLDTCKVVVWVVAARLDGKGLVVSLQGLHDKRQLLRVLGLQDARRLEIATGRGPVVYTVSVKHDNSGEGKGSARLTSSGPVLSCSHRHS